MNEDTAAAFQREGEITIAEDTAEETAADSQSGDENQDGKTQSADGEKNNQTDDDKKPFHEHPRWKQREDEWNNRFNQQEQRHAEELKNAIESIRSEFGGARKDNAQQTKIPAWFGGTQEQWDAYRADRDAELEAAEKRAVDRLKNESKQASESETKAVQEATDWMNSEVSAIEADTTLNPSGESIDKAALLKIVVDNELVDTKGRWNYRAGFRLMQKEASGQNQQQQSQTKKTDEKKKIAAATTTEGGGDQKKANYATSEDFKGSKRPW